MKRSILYAFTIIATVVYIAGPGQAKSQDKKEIRKTIIINDGDTIINGKKLRDATPGERKALLKELDQTEKNSKDIKIIRKKKDGKQEKEIIIRRGDTEPKVLRRRSENDREEMKFEFKNGDAHVFKFDSDSMLMAFGNDSLMKEFRFKIDGLDSNFRKGVITMNRNFNHIPRRVEGTRPELFMDGLGIFEQGALRRENSQVFIYENTDKDGITSRMSIRISEANDETLKKMNAAGNDKPALDVSDLTLSPNFSSGNLNLSFSLIEKGSLEVKILDSNLKELFTDKTTINSGTYFKQISLPKNGVYYIRIIQGNKTFVRKMVKE